MTQPQAKINTALFCDLKTDEEKSTFFLSGRGYETGVVAHAIQNDVAMAYHRCSEYRKELEALQAECAQLRAAIRRLCNIYVVDDYYDGQLREGRLDESVNRAIDAAMEKNK